MKKLLLSILISLTFLQNAKAQHFDWVKQIGNVTNEHSGSMTIDGKGYVYLTGRFDGTLDFDPGPGVYNLTSSGQNNVFIAKFDTLGNLKWATGTSGGSVHWPSVDVDDNGNVYSSGFFYNTVDFAPGSGSHSLTRLSTNGADIYIGKWDSLGNIKWIKQYPHLNWNYDIIIHNMINKQ
jgi:hypothetical protein